MTKVLLAFLTTIPVQDHDYDKAIGQFELEVHCEQSMLLSACDKPAFIKRQISAHLASAIMDTKVPIEYWRANINREVAKYANLPETLSFAVRR